MTRFVQAHFAAAGNVDGRDLAPSNILHGSAGDSFSLQVADRGLYVVADQVEFVVDLTLGRMNAEFSRRKREDQPTVSGVNCWESQHVSKECANLVRITGVDERVNSVDHGAEY